MNEGGDTLLTTGGEVVATAATAPEEPVQAITSSADGSSRARIGRYQCVRELGAGGMGVVWEAMDPELGRGVAIKLLREGRGARLAERLRREARALAQLDHPNVVSVYDVGVDDGELYLVMQLVEGVTLDRLLERSRLTTAAIVTLVASAGRGLAAAHSAGIVHRDFKPTNVLVDDDGNVRVSDFGLARASDAGRDEGEDSEAGATPLLDASITRGELVGTPAYMAPEQFRHGPVTAATDQFAFCITLWEALVGERPFPGLTLADIRAAVLEGRRQELPARLPRRVRAVLAKGLSIDPNDRFASMDELLDELSPRRRGLWVAGAIGGAALVAAIAYATVHESPPDPCGWIDSQLLAGTWDPAVASTVREAFVRTGRGGASDTAQQVIAALDRYANDWVTMRRSACEATHTRHEQSPMLLDLRNACLEQRASELGAFARVLAHTTQPESVDKAIGAALELPRLSICADGEALRGVVPAPVDPVGRVQLAALRAQVFTAQSLGDIGSFKEALGLAEHALDGTRRAGYAPLLSQAQRTASMLELKAGDIGRAERLLHEAAESAAAGKDDRQLAQAWLQLGRLLHKARRFDDGLAIEPFMKAAVVRAGDDPELATTFDWVIGLLARDTGNIEESKRRFVAALDRLPPEMKARRADILQSYSILLKGIGQQAEAIAALEEATKLISEEFGPNSFRLTYTLYNQARQYLYLERCDEAKSTAARSLAISARAVGADSPDLVLDYITAGDIQALCFHDAATAREHYAHALRIAEASPENGMVSMAVGSFGWGMTAVEQYAEAEPYLVRAIELARGKSDPVNEAQFDRALGTSRLALGRPREALAPFTRAAELYAQMKDAIDLHQLLGDIGDTQLELGRTAEAIATYERALAIDAKFEPWQTLATRFGLARALWSSGRDRARAVALAREVAAVYATLDKRHDKNKLQVDRWLAQHAPPRGGR